jgi:hypothetical protein
MKKLQLLFFLCSIFFITNCNRKAEFVEKKIDEQVNKKGFLWKMNVKNQDELNSIIRSGGSGQSGQPVTEGTCSGGFTDVGYGVEYDCTTGKYTLFFEMWVLAYYYQNLNMPTNVKVTILGNQFSPVSIDNAAVFSPHAGYKCIFRIPFDAIGVNYCNTSSLLLYFTATVNNCSSPINISWNLGSGYNVNLVPTACSGSLQYSPGSFPNGFRVRQFTRLLLVCGPCKIPNPDQMVYEYRIIGTSAWSSVTSTTAPLYNVNTPQLSPGTYEYRCRGLCNSGASSAYSVIQPGINQFTIQ